MIANKEGLSSPEHRARNQTRKGMSM